MPLNIQLVDSKTKEDKQNRELKEKTDLNILNFEKGYNILIREIDKINKIGVNSIEYTDSFEKFKINSELMKLLKHHIALNKSNQEPLYLICGYSEEIILEFYERAVTLCEEARYEDCINAFIFLTTLHPTIPSFWSGLGLAYEKNLDSTKAMESFEKAINADLSNFSAFYGLIRICESINNLSRAKELLENQINNESIKEDVENALYYIKSLK